MKFIYSFRFNGYFYIVARGFQVMSFGVHFLCTYINKTCIYDRGQYYDQ